VIDEARRQGGDGGAVHRFAYRCYRLAKEGWYGKERAAADEALGMALRLGPRILKYSPYQWQWRLRGLGPE